MNTKRKTKRVLYKGKLAKQGTCVCGGILIITDPDHEGTFESHHEAPMCAEYKARCAKAESLGVGWAEIGKDIVASDEH